jgi:hypothetical protein
MSYGIQRIEQAYNFCPLSKRTGAELNRLDHDINVINLAMETRHP